MAWIRQLESGLWAATIYTPTGDRVTQSHKSKGVISDWASRQEASKRDGQFIDPRLGRTTVGELWDLYGEGRRLEKASLKRDASHWRKWVGPKWGSVAVGPIRKPDVSAWVVKMERDEVGGWTITAALNVLRSMLEIAVDLRLIASNPTAGVKVPPPAPHVDRVLDESEDKLLLDNLEARFPDNPSARLFVEMLIYCGTRYEELAALDTLHVVKRDRLLSIGPVMEKDGTIRPHPKSESAIREVSVDDDLWPRFWRHVETVPSGDLVFTAPDGGPLLYDNWLKRVWNKGLLAERKMTDAEIEAWKEHRRAEGLRPWKAKWVVETPVLADPQPTPHDMRHTFGTRMADAGMTEHELAALMGHSPKGGATKRYIHARRGRFDKARQIMAQVRRQASTLDRS